MILEPKPNLSNLHDEVAQSINAGATLLPLIGLMTRLDHFAQEWFLNTKFADAMGFSKPFTQAQLLELRRLWDGRKKIKKLPIECGTGTVFMGALKEWNRPKCFSDEEAKALYDFRNALVHRFSLGGNRVEGFISDAEVEKGKIRVPIEGPKDVIVRDTLLNRWVIRCEGIYQLLRIVEANYFLPEWLPENPAPDGMYNWIELGEMHTKYPDQ